MLRCWPSQQGHLGNRPAGRHTAGRPARLRHGGTDPRPAGRHVRPGHRHDRRGSGQHHHRPPTDENAEIRLSVTLISAEGKPIRQVLPGLRFAGHFARPNRLAFGPEYGPLTAADSLPLPEPPPALRSQVLLYAEALGTISQYANATITLPLSDLPVLTADDFAAGVEHNLGSAISYLPSTRAEGDPDAEPGPDGTITVTLVPGDNNDAIRSVRNSAQTM